MIDRPRIIMKWYSMVAGDLKKADQKTQTIDLIFLRRRKARQFNLLLNMRSFSLSYHRFCYVVSLWGLRPAMSGDL